MVVAQLNIYLVEFMAVTIVFIQQLFIESACQAKKAKDTVAAFKEPIAKTKPI